MSLVANEINRRRHIRWKLEKHAVLFIPGSNPVPCVIYDFCSGGLFLEFNSREKNVILQQNQQVKVFFSIHEQSGENDFQFDVEIMRICSNGIGVAFQHIPMSAFQALVKEANLKTVPVSLTGLNQFPDQNKKKSFEKSFKKLLAKSLPLILKEFFTEVDKELLKISDQAENTAAKTVYYNSFTTLKNNRKLIVYKFCNSVLKEIHHLDNSKNEESVNKLETRDNNAEVNKDEMGDWIDLSSIIRRTEAKYASKLNGQELKLSQATGIPANHINNPLTPAKLFYSFRETIENPVENNEIRKAFYKIFERVLVSQLDGLYMQFDGILVEKEVSEKQGSIQLDSVENKSQSISNAKHQDLKVQDTSDQPVSEDSLEELEIPSI